MKEMSRLVYYSQLKTDFALENYVTAVKNRKQRGLIAKARMGILPIRIETGRYTGLPRNERVCTNCDDGVVEDKPHVLFHCPKYDERRTLFYNELLTNELAYNIKNSSDTELIKYFIFTENINILYATARFLYDLLYLRAS